jgi:hypothetical protein
VAILFPRLSVVVAGTALVPMSGGGARSRGATDSPGGVCPNLRLRAGFRRGGLAPACLGW